MSPHASVICQCGPTCPNWPYPCGPHVLAQNPHAHVTCPFSPHAQLGLARVAHTATFKPLHGRVLHMAKPLSITRSCLAHSHPHRNTPGINLMQNQSRAFQNQR
ncbi:hypothetical protein PVK06_024879 [Gossypium arboreum]|uniref:Uncharacterized protein n=1 Tax=Gossypium arboreum TaxID=29729 RepID=A0ABR0PFB9_GOSAR|nr:hypothetical protein PVK06_024879 [Gossypium arboreum]